MTLHPAYEGTFALRSSNLNPRVEQGRPADPAGKDRKRTVDVRTIARNNVYGKVYWKASSARKEESYVKVTTSNSPAVLRLI